MRRQLPRSLIRAITVLSCCCFVAGVVGGYLAFGSRRQISTLPMADRLLVQFVGLGAVGIPFGFCLVSLLLAYRFKPEDVNYAFSRFVLLVVTSLCLLTPVAPVALYCVIQLRRHWDTFTD